MTKKLSLLLAIILIATLALTACKPGATTGGSKAKICEVTDTGGIDDKSFNATAWAGAEKAQKDLGVTAKYLESQQQTDYEKNINAFIDEKCDLIITVGFLLADATKAAAEKNPTVNFTIIDSTYDPVIPNVLGQAFAVDQASFLAGYLAAGMTKTGKVGTFGGIQIPPVTAFMDGFAMGVKYYNDQNGTSVQVLGWDSAAQTGLFTGNFESTDDGRTMGQTLLGEGADIIMPVAGPVGLGTAEAVKTAGNAWIVGVDTDWTVSAADYKDIVLTSVKKNMDSAVYNITKTIVDKTFKGGVYQATIDNGGVGLATIASAVPADLKAKVEAVQKDIVSGKVKTMP
jgi:basic membrane protein A and related proteins